MQNEPSQLPSTNTPHSTEEVARLRMRISELEALLFVHGIALPKERTPVTVVPPPPPPIVPPPTAGGGAIGDATGAAPSPTPSEVERFVGVKLAALAGALAVLGAIGYFVKYAIDTGLFGRLGPEAKFGATLALAAAFLIAAERVRVRYSVEASRGLYGAGVVALFAAVFAGAFVLQLFGVGAATILVAGAGLVGVACAVRSASATVGILALLGALALPILNGFDEGAVLSGIELTVVLLIAAGLTALGPPSFARVRDFALVGGVPMSIVWAVESGVSPPNRALFICVWWGIFAGSCVFEAMRGRTGRDNAITLAAVSASALLGCIAATGGGSSLSDPLAYLPLLIGGGLAIVGVQLRAMGEPADPDEARDEPVDGLRADVASACSALSVVAIGCAPLALVTALGVFLNGDGLIIGAAGAAVVLAFATARLKTIPLIPGCLIAMMIGWGASFWQLLTSATTRPSVWPGSEFPIAPHMAEMVAFRFSAEFLAPTAVMVLFFLPLFLDKWPRALARTMGVFGALLSVVVVLCFLGPFPASFAFSALAVAIAMLRQKTARLADGAWCLLALGYCIVALLCLWVATVVVAQSTSARDQYLWLQAAFVVIAHIAPLWVRSSLWEKARGFFDAALVLELSALCTCLFLIRMHESGDSPDALFARVALILSISSVVISLLAYGRRSIALGRAAVFAVLFPVAIVATVAMIVLFGRETTHIGSDSQWLYAAIAPSIALLVARKSLRKLGATPLTSAGTKNALQAVVLATVVSGCVLLAGEWFEGYGRATALISLLSACAVTCLVWGFKGGVAGARWVGLGLLALLSLRLTLIDLAQTSALVRVVLLFAAGLILVGTSIAYALLRPRRES